MIGSAVNRLPRNETVKRGVYALGIEDRLERYEHVFSLAPAERIDGLFRGGPPQDSLAPFEPWRALLRDRSTSTSSAASSTSKFDRRFRTNC